MWWPKQRIRPPQVARAEARRAEAQAAAEHLCRVDRRFAPLIERYGLERPIVTRDPFVALFGSILQQQISMSAANAVLKRVKALCPRKRISAKTIAGLTPVKLRAAGLSRQKILYVHDLARHFLSGELAPRRLHAMTDDEVVEHTTRVHGVGRWTAEMLLIFCLERADVWPVDDLGLRKGAMRLFGHPEMLPPKQLIPVGEPYRPFRSYATWYLWRSLEGPLMPGIGLGEKGKVPRPANRRPPRSRVTPKKKSAARTAARRHKRLRD